MIISNLFFGRQALGMQGRKYTPPSRWSLKRLDGDAALIAATMDKAWKQSAAGPCDVNTEAAWLRKSCVGERCTDEIRRSPNFVWNALKDATGTPDVVATHRAEMTTLYEDYRAKEKSLQYAIRTAKFKA